MESVPCVDLNLICRICLKGEAFVSIYSDAFAVRPLEMIVKLDLFRVDTTYALPSWLCQSCISRLIDAYNLKEQCEISNIQLNEYFGSQNDANCNSVKPFVTAEDPSIFARDSETYNVINITCEMLNENQSQLLIVNDNRLNDVIIDVNSLTQSEDSQSLSVDDRSVLAVITDASLTQDSDQSTVRELQPNDAEITEGVQTYSALVESTSNQEQEQLSCLPISQTTDAQPSETSKRHEKLKNKKKTSIPCSICGKVFTSRFRSVTHMRIHTGEKPFECKICERSFTQMTNLKLHMRTHTGEKRYQCDICSQYFTTSSNLKVHQVTHSKARNFQCSECLRTFKTAKDLNSHFATHSNMKLYPCKICHRDFLKVSYLNNHVRKVHEGERKHKCSECNKTFSNSSNLICHLRTHTGEKPYMCTVCNATFNQSSALMRHSKRHSKSSTVTTSSIAPENVHQSPTKKLDIDNILMSHNDLNTEGISPLTASTANLLHDNTRVSELTTFEKELDISEYVMDLASGSNHDF